MEDDSKGEFVFQNDEYRAWKKMKLHPLLMKSIRRLGFKEPTPIQKACIPVAAHQGKVSSLPQPVSCCFERQMLGIIDLLSTCNAEDDGSNP